MRLRRHVIFYKYCANILYSSSSSSSSPSWSSPSSSSSSSAESSFSSFFGRPRPRPPLPPFGFDLLFLLFVVPLGLPRPRFAGVGSSSSSSSLPPLLAAGAGFFAGSFFSACGLPRFLGDSTFSACWNRNFIIENSSNIWIKFPAIFTWKIYLDYDFKKIFFEFFLTKCSPGGIVLNIYEFFIKIHNELSKNVNV